MDIIVRKQYLYSTLVDKFEIRLQASIESMKPPGCGKITCVTMRMNQVWEMRHVETQVNEAPVKNLNDCKPEGKVWDCPLAKGLKQKKIV